MRWRQQTPIEVTSSHEIKHEAAWDWRRPLATKADDTRHAKCAVHRVPTKAARVKVYEHIAWEERFAHLPDLTSKAPVAHFERRKEIDGLPLEVANGQRLCIRLVLHHVPGRKMGERMRSVKGN